jgi:hypothetical protein
VAAEDFPEHKKLLGFLLSFFSVIYVAVGTWKKNPKEWGVVSKELKCHSNQRHFRK